MSPQSAINGNTGLSRQGNDSLRTPKVWRSNSRTWTKRQLAREREIFWETQVTGQAEVWAALKLAIDMMIGTGDQPQPDPQAAQAVVEAAGCTCPTGRLGEGVWDDRGRLYKLPRWILSDPINVKEGYAAEDEDEDMPEDDEVEEEDDSKDNDLYDETEPMDKGKDRVYFGPNAITVIARMSDRGTDLNITLREDQSIRSLIRRVQSEAGLPTETKLRIAYMGRILKEHESLVDQGWKPEHVVNVLVFK